MARLKPRDDVPERSGAAVAVACGGCISMECAINPLPITSPGGGEGTPKRSVGRLSSPKHCADAARTVSTGSVRETVCQSAKMRPWPSHSGAMGST